jgi:hypothetical protein
LGITANLNIEWLRWVRNELGRPDRDALRCALSAKTAGDLFARRKATGSLLREREPAIDANFEDAAARPPQAQLRRGSQLGDQFPRLTGARFITSLAAVFDLDCHEFVLST